MKGIQRLKTQRDTKDTERKKEELKALCSLRLSVFQKDFFRSLYPKLLWLGVYATGFYRTRSGLV